MKMYDLLHKAFSGKSLNAREHNFGWKMFTAKNICVIRRTFFNKGQILKKITATYAQTLESIHKTKIVISIENA